LFVERVGRNGRQRVGIFRGAKAKPEPSLKLHGEHHLATFFGNWSTSTKVCGEIGPAGGLFIPVNQVHIIEC
jgi:hypothetical protein